MKKLLIPLSGILFVLASCKEKAAPINLGGSTTSADTTYVLATVPSADPHQVLIEEFTGQNCSNCPRGHDDLISLQQQYAGKLNIIALYFKGGSPTDPLPGSLYDFRDSIATLISNVLYNGVGSIPSAGIDRLAPAVGSGILLTEPWGGAIADRVNATDSVNLTVSSIFNATAGTASITYKVTYTQPTAYPQSINIVVVEDSVTDLQEFPDSLHSGYVFTNIFRSMITAAPFGDAIKPDILPKEAGRVVQQSYNYTLKAGVIAQHSRVIAYVTNGTSNAVIQSAQCKLTGI